uniref:Uncharacterized protein n=2 Tax=Iconisemion striatum TaxID=60296 RepID=A0A1A7XGQ0_9TELE
MNSIHNKINFIWISSKGKPAYEMDETNPDWVPTLHMGHSEVSASNSGRHERRLQRMKNEAGVQDGAAECEGETPSEVLDKELREMQLTEEHHHNHLMMEAVVQWDVGKVEAVAAHVENGDQTEGETEERCQKME